MRGLTNGDLVYENEFVTVPKRKQKRKRRSVS